MVFGRDEDESARRPNLVLQAFDRRDRVRVVSWFYSGRSSIFTWVNKESAGASVAMALRACG
jgi:hypothetical protein